MVTNEERREVARKLRNSDIERHQLNPMVSHATVTICGSSIVCIDEESLRMALDYLADLIEPEPERKAKSKPFPVEKDTGYFDTTNCECGYLNDVSATYCGQCGGVIEVVHYAN